MRRGRTSSSTSSDPNRHILYFHGGAFLVGGSRLHQAMVSRIAEATRATVLSVGYRKLPRHPVSTSVADGLDGYRHLLDSGVDPAGVVFMGDSAGGFLTFTVADLASQEGLPAPGAIVAMSPLLDFDFSRTAVAALRRGDSVFGPRSFPRFALLAARREPTGRVHSPVDCDLAGMPPVLLQVSSSETLYPQVCRMAELLEEAGVAIELQVWDRQVHVFQAARPLPEAQQAVAEIGSFVERSLIGVRRKTA